MKLQKRRWGLDKVAKEVEVLLLSSPYLRGDFYALWLSLSAEEKQGFLNALKRVVRRNLLDKEFILALCKDIIRKDKETNVTYIDTQSHVYEYLKVKVYRGDLRFMLAEIQSIIEESV